MIAGDGNPPPGCIPPQKCGDFAPALPTLVAGDGNPPPACIPPKNCGDFAPALPRLIAADLTLTYIPDKNSNDKNFMQEVATGAYSNFSNDLETILAS
jgi:hypothetical protein